MRLQESLTLATDPEVVSIKVQQLDAYASLRLFHKLAKAGVPALGRVFKSVSAREVMDADVGEIFNGVGQLLAEISADELVAITDKLFEGAVYTIGERQGTGKPFFAMAFDGHPDLLIQAILFGLRLNYSSFLEKGRALLAKLPGPAAPQSKSPQP